MHLSGPVKSAFFLGLALSGFVWPALGQTAKREHFQNADVL